ncbi:hypothetical protein pb186bvf_014898 [Paramecium bursaria]
MKTQTSQQSTPKVQKTPVKQDFMQLYEKYLNQARKRSNDNPQPILDIRTQLQQSTSLHYLTKKSEVGVHRFSLDNFNAEKRNLQETKSTKGLKSYLTTINSSTSMLQKGNSSYFPNKNDSSQGRSQTVKYFKPQQVDGQSTDEIERKPIKNDKFLSLNSLNLVDIVSKTKRITEKLSQIPKSITPTLSCKVRGSPTLAHLLKVQHQRHKEPSYHTLELKQIFSKTRLILENFKRENKLLQSQNEQISKELIEALQTIKKKDFEIECLRLNK